MKQNNPLTPQQIVQELDKYIIGQKEAKKLIAIALRNRWRKAHTDTSIRDEITPTNILMIGPTGSGKTELCRRLASICDVPFVKVEATSFTEKGYVGGDVNNIIHQLADKALLIVKKIEEKKKRKEIEARVEEIILNILIPTVKESDGEEGASLNAETRKHFLKKIRKNELDDRIIEIEFRETPPSLGFIGGGMVDANMMSSLNNMMSKMIPVQIKKRQVTIKQAKKILFKDQLEKSIDPNVIKENARKRAEFGFVILDEIDKTTGSGKKGGGPDVSRQGVQRDLLPLVEGTSIMTKIGTVKTDHILFIAAGAFHNSKPSDLMPEFQGRFPVQAKLHNLTEENYFNILQIPKNALIKQQKALLATEGVTLDFTEPAIRSMAQITMKLNTEQENIGARRLRTVIIQALQNIPFDIPEKIKAGSKITINKKMVEERLNKLLEDKQSSHYII